MAKNYNSLKEVTARCIFFAKAASRTYHVCALTTCAVCVQFLESRYPELQGKVVGAHHPPPWHAMMMQKVAGVVQWGGIGLMFFGGSMFKIMAVPEPPWYGTFTENKMNAMIGMFFKNSICNSMVATGAFEGDHLLLIPLSCVLAHPSAYVVLPRRQK
jgi:hypothetical protein